MSMNAADKHRITSDWQRQFPRFGIWRPLRLCRRLGPIVQGIALDSTPGGDYFPTAHVHALVHTSPTVSLSLATRLAGRNGVHELIRMQRHDQHLAQASASLKEQSPLSLDEEPSLIDVVAAYRARLAAATRPGPTSVGEVEDLILVPAAQGRADLVAEQLEFAKKAVSQWPRGSLQPWELGDDRLEQVHRSASDRAGLVATVEEEADRHGLRRLPEHLLL
jgi:hypothetical protein